MNNLEPHHDLAFLVVGGPTVIIDIEGVRFVTDPTFDEPTDYGLLRKIAGPSIPSSCVADADVVLVSHADHVDNLDHSGKTFALAANRLLTNPGSAAKLGSKAQGLAPWESISVAHDITVTAVPAIHGPADGEPDESGFVNCEVTGFVIETPQTRLYITGDNTSFECIGQIKKHFESFDYVVMHAGRATVAEKFGGRPLSLSAERASAAGQLLESPHIIPVHQSGWAHFVDGPGATIKAFKDAGILDRLDQTPEGQWSVIV
ncbi:MBL fold metallo-hydrolase [Schaalia vaccimaxillae]|uniref:MBL fold metallo-hydrolase n=1 Tax=Schaalia vaccimaxillae TaxID=183916 RepID=UPI0003B3AAE2|nr:MBL fold metallo-hydrolase [Schaalia vaccimaxillae]